MAKNGEKSETIHIAYTDSHSHGEKDIQWHETHTFVFTYEIVEEKKEKKLRVPVAAPLIKAKEEK